MYQISETDSKSSIEDFLGYSGFTQYLTYFYTTERVKNNVPYQISGFMFYDAKSAKAYYNGVLKGENVELDDYDWDWDCDGVCYSSDNQTVFLIGTGLNSGVTLTEKEILKIFNSSVKYPK